VLTPSVRRDEGWLLYSAALPRPFPEDRERLLAWSGELAGNCKFGCDAAHAELRVQAELPLSVEADERVAWVEAGFAAAAERLGLATVVAVQGALLPMTVARELAELCDDAGWPGEKRADGSLAVDLGVQGAYVPATVERCGERIAVETELVGMPEVEGPCRAALVAFLLRVNGAFRMARAVVRGSEPRAFLEVWLPLAADAEELGEAIAALAVAAQRSALEARLLACDERLAAAYLERLGIERSGTVPPVRGT